MATQLSAITMIGTTGQAFSDGMRFIQFYFALPLAMIILSVTLVPFFYNARVYTAYEYLEKRFDARVRSITSLLFLISRGLSVGAIISAPAVVLSLVLDWNIVATSVAISLPAIVYTMFGGVQAVTWTDVKTMSLIVGGLVVMIVVAILGLPDGVGVTDGLAVAANAGRMRTFDFSFDLTNPWTFWSGTIAALFLFCSYFGADQSQVQRYLTARSLNEARRSLLMSAYWKIPLQVIVLLVGVLVFVFYTFNPGPLLYSRDARQRMQQGAASAATTRSCRRSSTPPTPRGAPPRWSSRRPGSRATQAGVAAASDGTEREGSRASERPDPRARSGPQQQRRQGVHGRCVVHGRQLRDPDVHPDPAAGRPDRAADRGDPAGRDRLDRRRAQLAVHRHRDRFLQTLDAAGGQPMRTI